MLLIAAFAAIACDLSELGQFWRRRFQMLAGLIACYGLATRAQRIWHLHALNRVGPSGFTHPEASPRVIAEIRGLDSSYAVRDGILFLPNPTLSMEAPLSRKISTDAASRSLPWFTERTWRGRVPILTLILPELWSADPRLSALLACFVEYRREEWKRYSIDGWMFLTAETKSP